MPTSKVALEMGAPSVLVQGEQSRRRRRRKGGLVLTFEMGAPRVFDPAPPPGTTASAARPDLLPLPTPAAADARLHLLAAEVLERSFMAFFMLADSSTLLA